MSDLRALGFTAADQQALDALEDPALEAGRVVTEHGRFLHVSTGRESLRAVTTGRLRHEAASAAALPTVGDWVALRRGKGDGALATIRRVLPRRSKFSRRGAGSGEEQVVAANVDTVFLMMGLDDDFNLRRLERYLSLALASGARPVVVLGKADLAPALAERQRAVTAIAAGMPVVAVSLLPPEGHAPVLPFLVAGQTVALLGSSGVGKSTLINRLAGADLQRTQTVRSRDRRGRHTTTVGQLFVLPCGALMIDTPGMRELQLWEAEEGVGDAFDDVEALAAACRFRDCSHGAEPGCAVRAAVDGGTLSLARYQSFCKLRAEARPLRPGMGRRPRR